MDLLSDNLSFYFVAENEFSHQMESAYSVLHTYIDEMKIKLIDEAFCLEHIGSWTKSDVVIVDDIVGEFFHRIKNSNVVILGSNCLLANKPYVNPVPNHQPVPGQSKKTLRMRIRAKTPVPAAIPELKSELESNPQLTKFLVCVRLHAVQSNIYKCASINMNASLDSEKNPIYRHGYVVDAIDNLIKLCNHPDLVSEKIMNGTHGFENTDQYLPLNYNKK